MKKPTRIISALAALVIGISCVLGTSADMVTLPKQLNVIEAKTFQGDQSLDQVYVPDNVTQIMSLAFADSSVKEIFIPDSVTSIADDAFEGADGVVFVVCSGSYAEEYAIAHGIETDTYDNRQARTDAMIEMLDNETDWGTCEVIGDDDIDFTPLSTEGITDPELLTGINAYNDALPGYSSAVQEYNNSYEDTTECLGEIDDLLNGTTMSSGTDHVSVSMGFFSAQMEAKIADQFGSDYEITNISTMDDGSAQLELLSNGKIFYLYCDSSGFTIQSQRKSSGVASSTADATIDTEGAQLALARSLDPSLAVTWANKIKDAFTPINIKISAFQKAAQQAMLSAKQKMEQELELSRLWAQYGNQDQTKSCLSKYYKSKAAFAKAEIAYKTATCIAKSFNVASIIQGCVNIAKDGDKLIKLNQIKNHGHATEKDQDSPDYDASVVSQLYNKITWAKAGLIANMGFELLNVGLAAQSLLSKATLAMPGFGLLTCIAVAVVKDVIKNVAVAIGSEKTDRLAQSNYSQAVSLDAKIHGWATPTPVPTATPTPTPIPTSTSTPAASTPTPASGPTSSVPAKTPSTTPASGHRYQVFTITWKTWAEAKAYCESLGGHLATITSAAEQKTVEQLCSQSVPGRDFCFWIGATDSAVEGQFKWITGEAWSYTNWGNGEPDNYSEDAYGCQNFLQIRTIDCGQSWVWDDAGEPWSDIGFICEWEDDSETATNTDLNGL